MNTGKDKAGKRWIGSEADYSNIAKFVANWNICIGEALYRFGGNVVKRIDSIPINFPYPFDILFIILNRLNKSVRRKGNCG